MKWIKTWINRAALSSNTYQVQNKLILTNVVDWLLESNILQVEYRSSA